MTSAKTMRLAALGAVASIVLAACSGSTATPAPSVAPSVAPSTGASAAPSQAPTGELPAPELTSLKIGLSNTEMSEWAAIIAVEKEILKGYGIDAEYSIFEGDAKVIAAVQAGQIDVGINGVSSVISSQLTDVPLVVLGVNAIVLTDDLVCQAGIDTAEEVKGQTVAISTFGGTSHGAALLSVDSLGLEPTDATYTLVGNQTARIAAVVAGSAGCAVVDTNKQAEMKSLGLSIAAQLKTAGIPWGRAGFQTTKDFVAKYPNTTLVLVASFLEGQQVIWEDPEYVIGLHQQVTGSSPEEAKIQVEDFATVGNRTLNWPDEAFLNPRKVMAAVNPDVVDLEIGSAFDRSFLEKLVELGFNEKIGAPTE